MLSTEPGVGPAGCGLDRHGWIAVDVAPDADDDRWQVVEEWVRTSYTLVAPKRLARLVIERDRPEA